MNVILRDKRLIQAALTHYSVALELGHDLTHTRGYIAPDEVHINPFTNELDDLIERLEGEPIGVAGPTRPVVTLLNKIARLGSLHAPDFDTLLAELQATLGQTRGDVAGSYFSTFNAHWWQKNSPAARLAMLGGYVEEALRDMLNTARTVLAAAESQPQQAPSVDSVSPAIPGM